jgi:hypothetical protein
MDAIARNEQDVWILPTTSKIFRRLHADTGIGINNTLAVPHNLRGESWKHHESLHRTGQVDECEARKSKRKYLHSYLVRLNFVNSR